MSSEFKVLYTSDEITEKCVELAEIINHDYAGKTIHLVCVLTGAVYFACELSKHITVPLIFDYITASSYGNNTQSSGNVKVFDISHKNYEGKDVLIVEDIIDTGNTLSTLKKKYEEQNPASVKICTMLDKPSRREANISVDYSAFTIPNYFVVGYGLDDLDETCRNLPYIGYKE